MISKVLFHSFIHLITKRIFQKVSILKTIPIYLVSITLSLFTEMLFHADAVLCISYPSSNIEILHSQSMRVFDAGSSQGNAV